MTTQRTVICGGPRTGKTTMADRLAAPNTRHTDDLIGEFDWSGVSAHVAEQWMTQPGPWTIEGVAAIRALRKAMDSSEGPPCDVLIWLTVTHETLTPGQASMSKGCQTVFNQIVNALTDRGVVVVIDPVSTDRLVMHSEET